MGSSVERWQRYRFILEGPRTAKSLSFSVTARRILATSGSTSGVAWFFAEKVDGSRMVEGEEMQTLAELEDTGCALISRARDVAGTASRQCCAVACLTAQLALISLGSRRIEPSKTPAWSMSNKGNFIRQDVESHRGPK